MNCPCPILLGVGVLPYRGHPLGTAKSAPGIQQLIAQSEVFGTADGVTGIIGSDKVSGFVLTIRESRHTENAVTVGASGVTAIGDDKLLQGSLLPVEVEAFYPPQHLVLVRRCREDDGRHRHGLRLRECSDSGVAVQVDVEGQMANSSDATL